MSAPVDLGAAVRGVLTGRTRTITIRVTLGLIAGAGLVAIFLRLINMGAVWRHLGHLSIGYALLAGGVFLTAYVARGLRWRCLMGPSRVSVLRAVAIYQVGIFLNWLLPVRGGEVAMSLLLRRTNGVPVSRSFAAVSMDKAMDLLPVVALLAVLPFAPFHLSGPLWALLISTLAFVALGATMLGLMIWRPERFIGLVVRVVSAVLPKRIRGRVESFVVSFVDTLRTLVHRPRVLLTALAYTAVALGLDATFCLTAFRAVGVGIAIPVALYGYTFFNFCFILPSPPGQVGSNELIGLLIFSGSFGLSRSGVAAMFLFSHPWTGLLMTCAGLGSLSWMGISLRSAFRVAGQEPQVAPEAAQQGGRSDGTASQLNPVKEFEEA
jgi:uncharacterized protein (TIRG00374 family)